MIESNDGGGPLARNVKAAREARGWGQRDLSAALGREGVPVSQAKLSNLESGKREPRSSELRALAKIFGVSIDALMADPGEFSGSLEWTSLRGRFQDAHTRLRRACLDYESAASAVNAYWEDHPGDHDQALHEAIWKSCADVASERYDHYVLEEGDDWRGDYGNNPKLG